MTRVLMTADTVGDVWGYACELVAALAPCGVEVTLATMGRALSPLQARRVAPIGNLEIVESSYALEWMPEPWSEVDAAGDWLLALAAQVRPDLVHVNGYAHAALPFGVPVIVAAHSCVWTWMRAVHGRDPGPSWREYHRRVRAGLATADVVVAPTAAILRAILEAYSVRPRSRVIPNGCVAAGWRPAGKAEIVLSAAPLWDEAKGLADLAACARRVDWPIVVAGSTVPPGGEPSIPTRGLHLLGELPPDQLAAWMARASIFALPARYEPFGLAILEAALAGCTLVLGDIATLREVWGDTAVYVPPGDPEALGCTLAALAADPLSRSVHAARSRARARTLSPARMAAAYRALYDELLVGRDARKEASPMKRREL
ncbi:MAG TPA: glycosyltransferase family 4 protein [Kofleriaceae bacterium]|nr:glycosyltransferase family 4 protein [Kofleriaceae bacterium]